MRIFEIEVGEGYKLVSEMRYIKSNYLRVMEINQRVEYEIKIMKQKNSYEINKNEEYNYMIKKLQGCL